MFLVSLDQGAAGVQEPGARCPGVQVPPSLAGGSDP